MKSSQGFGLCFPFELYDCVHELCTLHLLERVPLTGCRGIDLCIYVDPDRDVILREGPLIDRSAEDQSVREMPREEGQIENALLIVPLPRAFSLRSGLDKSSRSSFGS